MSEAVFIGGGAVNWPLGAAMAVRLPVGDGCLSRLLPDPGSDMRSLGGKLIAQLMWDGYSRSLFVPEFAEELLHKAGFSVVRHVSIGQTHTEHRDIVSLDNRPEESFFVEAIR